MKYAKYIIIFLVVAVVGVLAWRAFTLKQSAENLSVELDVSKTKPSVDFSSGVRIDSVAKVKNPGNGTINNVGYPYLIITKDGKQIGSSVPKQGAFTIAPKATTEVPVNVVLDWLSLGASLLDIPGYISGSKALPSVGIQVILDYAGALIKTEIVQVNLAQLLKKG